MAIFFPRAISASPFQSAPARPPVLLNIPRRVVRPGRCGLLVWHSSLMRNRTASRLCSPHNPQHPYFARFSCGPPPSGDTALSWGASFQPAVGIVPPGVDCESNVVRPRPSRAHTGLEAVCACPTIASTPISPAFPADRIPPGTQPAHHYKEGCVSPGGPGGSTGQRCVRHRVVPPGTQHFRGGVVPTCRES